MQIVNDQIYYHINTGKRLSIGSILNIGAKPNNFCREIYSSEFLASNGKDANELLLSKHMDNGLQLTPSEAELIKQTINNSAMVTRELVFEEVRREVDNKLPSRLECLYVCKTPEEIEEWCEIFKRTNKRANQVLKLSLTGRLFEGDASFILRQNVSLDKKREQARKYWTGARRDNIVEYLFIGRAAVVDTIE